MAKPLDAGSIFTAAVTLALFVAALFEKGVTHDLFLEAGVFLVSVKIIQMSYKNGVAVARLDQKLDRVLAALTAAEKQRGSEDRPARQEPPVKVPE